MEGVKLCTGVWEKGVLNGGGPIDCIQEYGGWEC